MHSPESEQYGFPRGFFPTEWRGHEIVLLSNNGHVTVDKRLSVHINLHCIRCNSDKIVRWRFSEQYGEYSWAAALSKLLILHSFKQECDGIERNTVIP
jgi:hypothetical protein